MREGRAVGAGRRAAVGADLHGDRWVSRFHSVLESKNHLKLIHYTQL